MSTCGHTLESSLSIPLFQFCLDALCDCKSQEVVASATQN